jgi:hypothetical protein
MASYWGFLVGPTTANVPSGPRGVGERPSSSRFFSKRTVQIHWQREQMTQDKINNIRIKPTIATLIQRYNAAIINS